MLGGWTLWKDGCHSAANSKTHSSIRISSSPRPSNLPLNIQKPFPRWPTPKKPLPGSPLPYKQRSPCCLLGGRCFYLWFCGFEIQYLLIGKYLMASKVAAPAPAKGFDANKFVTKGLNAETVQKLKEVFDVFDYDGSGNVSAEELINTIRALNLEAQAGQIIAIVHNSGHSGDIDFAAFLSIFGFNGDSTSESTLQTVFEAFDCTGSGSFTAEDFEKAAGSVGEHFSAAEVDQMIDYADKDRDGAISFEEFVNVVTKVYPKV